MRSITQQGKHGGAMTLQERRILKAVAHIKIERNPVLSKAKKWRRERLARLMVKVYAEQQAGIPVTWDAVQELVIR